MLTRERTTRFSAPPFAFLGLEISTLKILDAVTHLFLEQTHISQRVLKLALQPCALTDSKSAFLVNHILISPPNRPRSALIFTRSQGGHQLVVHTIVTGGQALLDTLHGAAQLVKQLDAARFVIWLNPFWGPVADNGRTFEQMNLFEAIKKRIETIVSLPAFTDELFPQDIASMLKSRLTFKEAIESPDHSLMSRHRLKVAQREFYSRLDSLAV
jgi:hypothetical protein